MPNNNPTGINQYTKGGGGSAKAKAPKKKLSFTERMRKKMRNGTIKSGPRAQSPIKYTRGL